MLHQSQTLASKDKTSSADDSFWRRQTQIIDRTCVAVAVCQRHCLTVRQSIARLSRDEGSGRRLLAAKRSGRLSLSDSRGAPSPPLPQQSPIRRRPQAPFSYPLRTVTNICTGKHSSIHCYCLCQFLMVLNVRIIHLLIHRPKDVQCQELRFLRRRLLGHAAILFR